MVVSGRTLKRANAKQRRAAASDLHDFFAFPAGEAPLDGAFRSNIKQFLDRFAAPPPPSSILAPAALAGAQHLVTRRVSFRVGGGGEGASQAAADEAPETPRKGGGDHHEPTPAPAVVDLDVVEEDVSRAKTVYCDHCRVVGWSGHPVCGKRYHFIIRNASNPNARTHQLCAKCCTQLDSSDTRCPSCKYEVTIDDLEEWANFQLEDPTHLLHGVIHANGYGHLLRVNGLEGGSKTLTGCDVMDFWDRICKMLRVRKVTVMDISKKYGLEYRLLHAVAMGRTWYGDWGYEFGAGSFGVTADAYHKAVETLSGFQLSLYFSHLKAERNKLHDIIAFYWSVTDRQLLTIRDLFRFLIEQARKEHKQAQERPKQRLEQDEATAGVVCPWNKENVMLLEDAMIKVLRAVGSGRWVTGRALRGATCRVAGSPEMLDHCLKGLAGRSTEDGSMVVAARCNPVSNAIEYRLEDASNFRRATALASGSCMPSEEQLVRDLQFLYGSLLNPQTMQQYQPVSTRETAVSAATRILDCKKFVKNYEESLLDECVEKSVLVWCRLELLDQPKDYTYPPPELLVLPAGTSIPDFRAAIQKAYQETYLVFRKFELDHVLELRNLKEKYETNADVRLLFHDTGHVTVRGRCSGLQNLGQYRKERGLENWTVDCVCGAADDDGERMVACDDCGVWRHTRCLDIKDSEDSPKKFICWNCNHIVSPAGSRTLATLPRAPFGKRSRDVAASTTTWGLRVHANGTNGLGDDEESRTGAGKKSRRWGDNATPSSTYMSIGSGKQGKYIINMPTLSEEEEYSDGSVLTEEGIGKYRDHPHSPPTPSGGGLEVTGRCIDDAVNLVIDLPTPMTISRVGRFITSVGC